MMMIRGGGRAKTKMSEERTDEDEGRIWCGIPNGFFVFLSIYFPHSSSSSSELFKHSSSGNGLRFQRGFNTKRSTQKQKPRIERPRKFESNCGKHISWPTVQQL
jgi:hypothetical protein